MSIKKMFEFSVPKEQEVEVKEETINEKGEKVITVKKEKQNVPQKFFVRKPTRSMKDEAQLYYWVKHSECIKAGILPKALMAKRFDNDDGILSKYEQTSYAELLKSLYDVQNDLQRLLIKTEEERSPEEKEKLTKLLMQSAEIDNNIQNFEYSKASIFDGSAEVISRDKTLMWWVFQLAYREKADNVFECLFGEGTYEEKSKKFEEIEEGDDEFLNTIIKKFVMYVTIWFINGVDTQEKFDQILKRLEERGTT